MRIAFVSTILGYPWGGADTLWTRAAEAAVERGDELLLCISPAVAASPRIAALRARGVRIHERASPAAPATLGARLVGRLRRLAGDGVLAELARFRPDRVIFSLGGTYDLILYPDWLDWLASSGTRFQLIANWQQENPVLSEAERSHARRALTLADQVNFVSARNLEVTRRHLLEPLPRARVLQNPLRWQPADVAPWPTSPLLQLATVSRLDEGKGIQLLLHALAAMPPRSDWRLNIYGSGPAEAYLRETVAHLHLEAHVGFLGQVQDLRAIWAENHLLVSPSIEDGVPMTVPETMLCERPVLATAVGGAEDWLRDGETGFLCAAPTLPLLTLVVQRALADHARWPAMGQAAARAAHTRYRPDDYLALLA
jgi:glycosyltransferase involved in cell wall biosynthesis